MSKKDKTKNEQAPIFEGWLIKKGAINTGWRKRWFVLDDTKLSYYEKANRKAKKGSILVANIEGVCVDPDDAQEWNAYTKGRVFRMRAETNDEANQWVEHCLGMGLVLHVEEGRPASGSLGEVADVIENTKDVTVFIGNGVDLVVTETEGEYYCRIYNVNTKMGCIGTPVETHKISNPSVDPWNEEVILKFEDQSTGVIVEYRQDSSKLSSFFIPSFALSQDEQEHSFPMHVKEDNTDHIAGSIHIKFKTNFQVENTTPITNSVNVTYHTPQKENGTTKTATANIQYRFTPPLNDLEGHVLINVCNVEINNDGVKNPYWIITYNGATVSGTVLDTPPFEWNSSAEFAPKIDEFNVQFSLYSHVENDFDIFIGDSTFVIEPNVEKVDLSVVLTEDASVSNDNHIEKVCTVGRPIIILPDFGDTSLMITGGEDPWNGNPGWFPKFLSSCPPGLYTSAAPAPENSSDEVVSWLNHIVLQEDGKTDLDNIQVRSISEVEATIYFDEEETLTNTGKLVKKLEDIGYEHEKNLKVFPYDWRLIPPYLEKRDLFFSIMRGTIEYMVQENNNTPAVLIGVGTGGLISQYFLSVTEEKSGKAWLEKQISSFITIGTPFDGCPKVVKAAVSGDNFGIENLSNEDSLKFWRNLGSTPMFFGTDDMFFINQEPTSGAVILEQSGASNLVNNANEDKSEYNEKLKVPSLSKAVSIYGVNTPTECGYCFSEANGKLAVNDDAVQELDQGYKLKNGIIYETTQTIAMRSGDGVNPYKSLSQLISWQDKVKEIHIHELNGISHEELFNSDMLLPVLSNYLQD